MAIRRIGVSNFKSYADLDIELNDFNVLIGANASGKSSFIEIFKFLRNIADDGLNNAISMQGGAQYLRNAYTATQDRLAVKVIAEHDNERTMIVVAKKEKSLIGCVVRKVTYEFALSFNKRGEGFRVAEDKVCLEGDFVDLSRSPRKLDFDNPLATGKIHGTNLKGKISYRVDAPELDIRNSDIYPFLLSTTHLTPKTLLLEVPSFVPLGSLIADLAVYDFDTKEPKKAVAITGKRELEENGSNLAIVLKSIIEDTDKKRKFVNLIHDILPFVDDLSIERFADRSLLFKLKESYSKNFHLPASLMSDGTINITAMIIALYFEDKPLVILEEPERNIHPFLISKVVAMFQEASQRKQIIVTTHNPEIVRYADLDNILLVSRNKDGLSTISRPGEQKELKQFLDDEMGETGIADLFVENLIGV